MSEPKKSEKSIERRDVLKLGTAATAGFVARSVMDETRRAVPSLPRNPATREAMRYVLSLPVSTVIVGCDDIPQLEENSDIARAFNPMPDQQLAQLEERAEPVHGQSLLFRRWRI